MPGRFRKRQTGLSNLDLVAIPGRKIRAAILANPPFLHILLPASVQVNRRQAVINKARST